MDDDQRHSTLLLGLLGRLLKVALFLDVSTKRWKLESLKLLLGCCLALPLINIYLSHIAHLALASVKAGNFTYLNLGFEKKFHPHVEQADSWILPSPCLASVVVGLAVGSGWGQVWTLDQELDCLRVVGLILGPRRWCRRWWSSHCWGWYTGAGSHSLPWWTSPNCSSRDSRRNGTTLGTRRRLRLEWFIWH